jgi:hypothetical protein
LEGNIPFDELKYESIENEPTPCQLHAYNIMDRLLDAQKEIKITEAEIIWWGNVALAWCEGYSNSQIQW